MSSKAEFEKAIPENPELSSCIVTNSQNGLPSNVLEFITNRVRQKFCSLDMADKIPGQSKANLLQTCESRKSICIRAMEDSWDRRCLCDTFSPILWLTQVTGVVPLHVHHTKNLDGERTGACQVKYSWKSCSSLANALFLFCFLGVSPVVYWEVRNRMDKLFDGTDLYAFTFQTMARFIETLGLLVAGRVYKYRFSKGWDTLTEVFHALCDSADDLCKIKFGAYLAFILVLIQGTFLFILNFWTTLSSVSLYDQCMDLYIGLVMMHLTSFIPCVFSTLFFFIALLLRQHFLKITHMLTTTLKNRQKSGLAARIDALRVVHEQLCTAVRHFEDFFGVQLLLTLVTGCFTMTTGAYALIIKGEGISSSKGEQMTAAWGCQLYCATIFILLILLAGQLITNSAISAAKVLNAVPLTDLDEKSQVQVTAFIHKISAFPTTIKAVNITTISTTFLASAATNITTYLLVLMQFKLSIEKGNLQSAGMSASNISEFEAFSSASAAGNWTTTTSSSTMQYS